MLSFVSDFALLCWPNKKFAAVHIIPCGFYWVGWLLSGLV